MRDADGAGERALDGERVEVVLAGEEQELLQFGAEEFGARRILERQRGQRLKHAEAAGIAAVFGFDADDGDDDFRRYAIERTGLDQLPLVFQPEAHAAVDAAVVQEARPVAFPRALQGRARRLDQLQNLGVRPGFGELAEQGIGIEAVTLLKVAGKVDYGRVVGKAGGRCGSVAKGGATSQ